MIVPRARAVLLVVAASIPALGVALAMPGFWYAGLVAVALVLGAIAADALAVSRPAAVELEIPRAVFVGEQFLVGARGSADSQLALEHDERLRPLGTGAALSLPFAAVRRGTARIVASWTRVSGPWGLVWQQRRDALDRSVAILPDVRPARAEAVRMFRRDASIGEVVQVDTGSGGDFQALTDFRSGMDRRAIDWKASARHGGLVAKEFRTERNNEIVFAIDAGRLMSDPVDGLPRIDRAVAAALTAAFVALKLGDRVSLFGFDAKPRIASGAVSGVAAFATFQALAAELDYSTEETNFTLALTTLGARLKRRSLVLVFTDFVDPTSAELMLTSVGRLAERHLVLFVVMRDTELEALIDAAPETPDDVSRAVVAAAMLRERRIVVARLQRLGVHIVEAHHAELGSALVNAYLGLKRRNLL